MQKIMEKFFNITPDASATLLITLLIFIGGYFVTAVVFLGSKYFKRRANRKLFIESLQTLEKPLNAQAKSFAEFILQLSTDNTNAMILNKVEFFQLPVFKEMSYKETFRSFFTGIENILCSKKKRTLKRRAFNLTWANINSLEVWNQKVDDYFLMYIAKYNEYNQTREESVQKLRQTWNTWFVKSLKRKADPGIHIENAVQAPVLPEQYINELGELTQNVSEILKHHKPTPYLIQLHLVGRIKELNMKYYTLESILDFSNTAMDASRQYDEMLKLINHTKQQFNMYRRMSVRIKRQNRKIIKILSC